MGLSKILAWCAVLATAAVIVSGEIVGSMPASGCADQGSFREGVAGSLFAGLWWALPWLLILGAQLIRLRYPPSTFVVVVSIVWILCAGLAVSAFVDDWPGAPVTHGCLYDDDDNLTTDLLMSWLLAWPCALFFMAAAAFAWQRDSVGGR